MSDDASDLAILAAVGGPPVRVPPLNDYQAVCLFLDQHGVGKGQERSVEASTLYRLYLAWFERQDRLEKVRPFSFCKQLRRIGYRKKHGVGRESGAMLLLVEKRGAKILRGWSESHPAPPEYAAWFKKHFQLWRKP